MSDSSFQLRTFIFIDQLQPQLAQFIAKDNRVYDPKEYDAAIMLELAPAMEIHRMINLALKAGMKVYECNLTPQNLLIADEVFLTNAVQGLRWVGSYRTKRYFNATTMGLVRALNAEALGELQA